jgi:SAM-dependent methyltransferase
MTYTVSQAACRFCKTSLESVVVDLGMSPLANSYLPASQLSRMEPFYPLKLYVCDKCRLVQVEEVESPANIFTDYAYFSSYSQTWLDHSKKYCDDMCAKWQLSNASHVVEIASNDGYLLQYFIKKGIPSLGIEPAANVAVSALERGVPTLVQFFGSDTATTLKENGKSADLLVGNNVLAHVPDLNDFVAGMRILLKPSGIITMEFPHLLQLMAHNQFDTIYHEHFSYFSLHSVKQIFKHHGLSIFDVEKLSTHGGSMRIYACHEGSLRDQTSDRLRSLQNEESAAGIEKSEFYASFADRVVKTKHNILEFLIEAKRAGKKVAAFGAPAKGNTLLNYCGIRSDFITFTVDDTPSKQGRYLPGSHIPVLHPKKIKEFKPDYLVIMPWNFKDEIAAKHGYISEWGGRLVTFIPQVSVSK